MLNVIKNLKLKDIFSEKWLFDILENDYYLTDELIQNDLVSFDGDIISLDINKTLSFIKNYKIFNIFVIEGNKTLHWT